MCRQQLKTPNLDVLVTGIVCEVSELFQHHVEEIDLGLEEGSRPVFYCTDCMTLSTHLIELVRQVLQELCVGLVFFGLRLGGCLGLFVLR